MVHLHFAILGVAVLLALKPDVVFRHYNTHRICIYGHLPIFSTQNVQDNVHTATSKSSQKP